MSAKKETIEDRIRDALGDPATPSETFAALLPEVRAAHDEADKAYSRARMTALTPTTPHAEVAIARQAMNDAEFERERLTAALMALDSSLDASRHAEAAAIRAAERTAAIAERDELAEVFRRMYPKLATGLASLLGLMLLSERRLAAAGLGEASLTEAVARGISPNYEYDAGPITRLTKSSHFHLPAMSGNPRQAYWPPHAADGGADGWFRGALERMEDYRSTVDSLRELELTAGQSSSVKQ